MRSPVQEHAQSMCTHKDKSQGHRSVLFYFQFPHQVRVKSPPLSEEDDGTLEWEGDSPSNHPIPSTPTAVFMTGTPTRSQTSWLSNLFLIGHFACGLLLLTQSLLLTTRRGRAGTKSAKLARATHKREQGECHRNPPRNLAWPCQGALLGICLN